MFRYIHISLKKCCDANDWTEMYVGGAQRLDDGVGQQGEGRIEGRTVQGHPHQLAQGEEPFGYPNTHNTRHTAHNTHTQHTTHNTHDDDN